MSVMVWKDKGLDVFLLMIILNSTDDTLMWDLLAKASRDALLGVYQNATYVDTNLGDWDFCTVSAQVNYASRWGRFIVILTSHRFSLYFSAPIDAVVTSIPMMES